MNDDSKRALEDTAGEPEAESPQLVTFDAIPPPAMAVRAEQTGIKRATADPLTTFALSVLAGAFIAVVAVALAGRGHVSGLSMRRMCRWP